MAETKLETKYYTIGDIIEKKVKCPVPENWIHDIPNKMGINLCAVRGIVVSKVGTQIVSIKIEFIPA